VDPLSRQRRDRPRPDQDPLLTICYKSQSPSGLLLVGDGPGEYLRQVEELRYLCVGVPREVGELEHLELLWRQRPQGLPDLGSLGVAPGLSEGLARLRGGGRCLCAALCSVAAGDRTQLIHAPMVDDGEYPTYNSQSYTTGGFRFSVRLSEGVPEVRFDVVHRVPREKPLRG